MTTAARALSWLQAWGWMQTGSTYQILLLSDFIIIFSL